MECPDAYYTSIQDAIEDASPGDEISVCPGTYSEALKITKSYLTIRGTDAASVIVKPEFSQLVKTSSLFSGANHRAIILVDRASGVKLENLTVDGADAASGWPLLVGCSEGFFGVFYRGASGVVQGLTVKDVKLGSGLEGCQNQLAVFVQSGKEGGFSAPGPRLNAAVAILSSTVKGYGKNGITCNEAGTTCQVQGNTVTGAGETDKIGQNGIQLGFGANGSVVGNTVKANYYTGTGWIACGILIYRAGGTVSGNTFGTGAEANQVDVCNSGSQEVPQHPPVQR
jgi:hypothetical protein